MVTVVRSQVRVIVTGSLELTSDVAGPGLWPPGPGQSALAPIGHMVGRGREPGIMIPGPVTRAGHRDLTADHHHTDRQAHRAGLPGK